MSPSFIHQPIVACADGTVVAAVDGYNNTYPSSKIYGNYVDIRHPDGNYTRYAHLMKDSIRVKVGQNIKQGDIIAQENSSGYSIGEHLHFEFQKGGYGKKYSIDPMPYLYVMDETIYINKDSKWYDRIQKGNSYPVTPIERNTRVDQIKVSIDNLRCRSAAGTDKNIIGFMATGYYNVLNKTETSGYTWYEVDEGKWCAQVGGVSFHEKEKQGLYAVNFSKVSNGDKEKLTILAAELALEFSIEEL